MDTRQRYYFAAETKSIAEEDNWPRICLYVFPEKQYVEEVEKFEFDEVYEVTVSFATPLTLDRNTSSHTLEKMGLLGLEQETRFLHDFVDGTDEGLQDYAKSRGHDAILVHSLDGGMLVVVLDPQTIKSVKKVA